jgi:hypothetical protein
MCVAAGVALGEALGEALPAGVGEGVGVGVGDGVGVFFPLGAGDGEGVSITLKRSRHVNPETWGHCKPFGPSAKSYVALLPLGIARGAALGEPLGVGVGPAAACGFTGGLTPGAAVPPPKLPWQAARASTSAAAAARKTGFMRGK